MSNIDEKTIAGFGEEWAAFDQTEMPDVERRAHFERYFSQFPWDKLPANAVGFDLGCGSGRWAMEMAPRVGALHCIDPSAKALNVARRRLGSTNVTFHLADAGNIPLEDGSQDFGYSLGVLHHVPDTQAALNACCAKLKPGAPFLLYLYYALDNRPAWFRALWSVSNAMRGLISRLPFRARKTVCEGIAGLVYWPLARSAALAERCGLSVPHWPLRHYRHTSFYTMRTDALDRFGTRLEQRFTRSDIRLMMERAGLVDIQFRDGAPYWVASGLAAK